MIKIDGFVVVHPISPWDAPHREDIISDLSYRSFGKTPAEAWRRHVGPYTRDDADDKSLFGRKVQFWFDRGYRIKKATMEIHDGTVDEEYDERTAGGAD